MEGESTTSCSSGFGQEAGKRIDKRMNWDDHRPTRQCRCRWHQYHWEYSTKVFFNAKNRQVLIDCVPLKVRFVESVTDMCLVNL